MCRLTVKRVAENIYLLRRDVSGCLDEHTLKMRKKCQSLTFAEKFWRNKKAALKLA